MQNVNIRKIELSPNIRTMLTGWNSNTAEWLRHSVYHRIYPPGSQGSTSIATFITFLLSAFWHGFYPGYYFSFLGMAWMTYISRNCRRYIRPLFLTRWAKYRIIYDIAGCFFTHFILAYSMPSFSLRRIDWTLTFCSTTFYHGHLILLLSSIFFFLGGRKLFKYLLLEEDKEIVGDRDIDNKEK